MCFQIASIMIELLPVCFIFLFISPSFPLVTGHFKASFRHNYLIQFSSSVVSDCSDQLFVMCDPMDCSTRQASLLASPTLGACSNSRPLSWWCHPTISSSVIPFSCLYSFPASESFPVSQFFAPGGQTIGASASASVLPMNIQDWFLLGLTGLISLQSKVLSRVFPNTTVQKHQFFGAQHSL